MSNVTPELVKKLREKTAVGIMDCKKALDAVDGDLDKAYAFIRQRAVEKAPSKADRVAKQGLIGMKQEGNSVVLVEVNCETDFVAKNDRFMDFVKNVVEISFKVKNLEELVNGKYLDGTPMLEEVAFMMLVMGEKIEIRKMVKLETANKVYSKISGNNNVGNSAVLLEVVGGSDDSIVKLMNHCSIMRPLFLTKDDVKGVDLSSNVDEFYKENCLMEQVIYGEATKVVDFLTTNSIKIVNYVMLNVGDGVEKKEENLADEVSKMVGK